MEGHRAQNPDNECYDDFTTPIRRSSLPNNIREQAIMKFCVSYVFPVLLLATIAVAQPDHAAEPQSPSARNTAQDLTPEQKAKIELLSKLQKHFGKDMSSPGVELSLKETNRSRSADRTLVTYSLYAPGLPSDTTYTLSQVQLDGSMATVMEGVTLNAKGEAICAGREGTCRGDGPNDPIDLVVYAGKGEPKRFGLVSNDEERVKGFVAVVPFPNTQSDKGCRLESIIGSPNGELTFIQGSGFEPNAELTIDSVSYGENIKTKTSAQADGSYFAALLPYVIGKKSGKTTIDVKSKNCNPKLTFEWGTYRLE
jgi:hypothetical protein